MCAKSKIIIAPLAMLDQHRCNIKLIRMLTVGLSVHNNGASSVSVSISLVGKNIVHSTTNLWHTGGESRRAGSESTCGGEGCGGDEEELHGCYS